MNAEARRQAIAQKYDLLEEEEEENKARLAARPARSAKGEAKGEQEDDNEYDEQAEVSANFPLIFVRERFVFRTVRS